MLNKIQNFELSNVKLIQLKTNNDDLYILHVGEIASILNSYFLNNSIQYSIHNGSDIEDIDIDVALINKDCNFCKYSLNLLNSLNLVVTYTKNSYIISNENFIHTSLIPILIRYLVIIKNSFSFVNYKKIKNSSKLFLKRVRAILDAHIDDPALSVEKICKLMYMSRSTFSKKIKNRTGLKPTEFINHYKLEKSKHLLLVTNWQINKIADALGFSSQHYYSRLFKTKEGINPLKYRLSNQEISLIKR